MARRHPAGLLVCAVVLLLVTVGSVVSAALVGTEQERREPNMRRAEEAYRRERQRPRKQKRDSRSPAGLWTNCFV